MVVILTQNERDFFIYQTLSGYMRLKTPDGTIIIKDPTDEIKYEAAEIYQEVVQCDLYDENEIVRVLYSYGIWTDDLELEYRQIPKDIEDLKVKIYKDQKNKILRRELRQKEKRIDQLLQIKHSWDAYTKQGYANFIKNQFIISKTAFKDNRPYENIFNIFPYLSKVTPTEKQIRELSRTEPWITLYEIGKRSDNDVGKRLLVYTKMYENIRNHDKCPSETIIDDDDALDGWMILQRKERDKQKDIEEIEQRIGKNNNRKQMFIPASTDTYGKAVFRDRDQVEKINNLNDETAKSKKIMTIKAGEKGKYK